MAPAANLDDGISTGGMTGTEQEVMEVGGSRVVLPGAEWPLRPGHAEAQDVSASGHTPRTLISRQGIVQNATGQHNGQRVWGGGIVKCKRADWIPWPIDLDDENPEWASSDVAGTPSLGAIPQNQQTEPFAQQQPRGGGPHLATPPAESSQQQQQRGVQRGERGERTGKALQGTASKGSCLALAAGPGLTVIGPRLPLRPGEANIHTGGLPPWLQSHNATSNLSDTHFPAPHAASSQSSKRARKLRNPKRVGAAWAEQRLREIEAEKEELERMASEGNPLGSGEGSGHLLGRQVGSFLVPTESLRGARGVEAHEAATWLPSFGRVWQSGSRKDSRREFEEERERGRGKRRTTNVSMPVHGGVSMLGQVDEGETRPLVVKPYVSKKLRQTLPA
eukprot:TRINITY_DN13783_c0_g1_i2.p1 TRINITY_DN13783_c0_g1~~TRINITY_DN13783_c0_g1_i2.p1  ORF type:complete len:392 (+),score=75.55 TRINITY_DN13783_c0_g1_i2:104-1279(+)